MLIRLLLLLLLIKGLLRLIRSWLFLSWLLRLVKGLGLFLGVGSILGDWGIGLDGGLEEKKRMSPLGTKKRKITSRGIV